MNPGIVNDMSLLSDSSMFSGFGSLILVALKVAAALCCLAAAQASMGSGLLRSGRDGSANIWRLYAILLIILAIFGLLHGDLLVSDSLRYDAKADDWYNVRRYVQFVFLLVVLPVAWKAYDYFQNFISQRLGDENLKTGLRGIALQMVVTLLQTVSWHYSDQILNIHLPGLSVASLLSLTAVGMVISAALKTTARLNRAA